MVLQMLYLPCCSVEVKLGGTYRQTGEHEAIETVSDFSLPRSHRSQLLTPSLQDYSPRPVNFPSVFLLSSSPMIYTLIFFGEIFLFSRSLTTCPSQLIHATSYLLRFPISEHPPEYVFFCLSLPTALLLFVQHVVTRL